MTEFDQLPAGGSAARAYIRVPADARAGIVVLHAWWGLNDDLLAFADRLVAEGYAIVAPDLFGGRIATEIDDADALASGSDETTIQAIVLAAVDHLAERLGPDAPIAALGFSFGAAWAIWAPTERARVVATVVYYGTWVGPVLGGATTPVLGHFAEIDPYETEETVSEFETGLRDAGRAATIHRYPGAGHWFAEPSRDAYRADDADLAFNRTSVFLRAHLGPGLPDA